MRVLVVEDNFHIADGLKAELQANHFLVDVALDGNEGSHLARLHDYDLVVLDCMLPGRSGLAICRDIRNAQKTCYILMLSVVGDVDEKVKLFDAGADDYMTKPFSSKEFLARVHALLRRPQEIAPECLMAGELMLDTRRHMVKYRTNDVVLTRKEFALLEYMMRNKGLVLSRSMIMEHVWDRSADPFSNTIETHVLSLRKKIRAAGRDDCIQTISGVGYKLTV